MVAASASGMYGFTAGAAGLLRSLRVVMVQAVGMAVVAALIGAGGFSALVFQGLLSSAIDLICWASFR